MSHPSPSPKHQTWLPPLRYSLPLIMLVSGLILILTETALFLAYHERRALDGTQERALRDGGRLARLHKKISNASFQEEVEATRSEPGVNRIILTSDGANAEPQLDRTADGREVIARFRLGMGREEKPSTPTQILALHLDLSGPRSEAREIAKKQALATATVLGIGAMLLWVVLDATVAKRAESIMASARAMTAGEPPGPELGGDDELAQIDRALRAAHTTIHEQAAAIQSRTELLAEKNSERSRLQQEIIQISEREQQRIGHDLHDDVCQRLAAVRMKIQDHEEKLAETAPLLLKDAGSIAADLAEAIHITRTLARGLSPVAIECGGFDVAMKGLARGSSALFGIDCQFESDELTPATLPHDAAHQLYRIAQECIANAAKHAKARHVKISLHTSPEHLVMRICNDGKPMRQDHSPSDGMGMTIMRHRAESAGASIEFETQPSDAVTAVRCTLPITTFRITENTNHDQNRTT